ncbi:FUSC family protein [Streptomyces sp. WAC06614]|uniref:FUSC family protein n=1 Tax=Streptomyces sp. WAC06614 TaxID=2487416 RepID=UPI000F79EC2B|nr:FUSC family protein [Streptomyces sp. WAC06614]RSS80788.1 hypothetical protein EF918_12475 [Streptomyces sp. WAC06614]
MAVGFPLLAGALVGRPEAGALACLGAYVTAFTNQGGPRGRRTAGLVVAGAVNALAFWAGEMSTGLFPVALALLLVLVFLAAMGAAVHGTVARLGTMPATALLAGAGQTVPDPAGAVRGALLVLAGGLWYAAATGLLTPAPRLRATLAAVAEPYREAARHLARLASEAEPPDAAGAGRRGPAAGHAQVVAALRRAERDVEVLRGPGGDERIAALVDPVLRQATALADLGAALDRAGPPPSAVARQFGAAAHALAGRLAHVARLLGRPGRATTAPPEPGPGPALTELALACDVLRSRAAAGQEPYALVAEAARTRRLLDRVRTATDAAHRQAVTLSGAAGTRLHPAAAPAPGFDLARLRAAMTPSSATYRHALRVTVVCAAVFTLVGAAGLPHGEWATLAVLRVLRPQYATTLERAGQRIVGNLVGGTCAALLIAGVHEPTVLAVLVFVIISAGFALRPVNYAFWVLFGTPLVLLIGDMTEPGTWQAAFERIAMTVLGSAAALLGGHLLWPTWDHDRLTDRTADATRACAAYLDEALEALARPRTAATDEARRAAEQSLAEARTAQRRARTEPGHDARAVAHTATVLADLTALADHLDALGAHTAARPPVLPGLPAYAAHASAALTAARPDERAAHAAALAGALDDMRLHLAELHARRLRELDTRPDDDTPARGAVRGTGPVVALLAEIEACVVRLTAPAER